MERDIKKSINQYLKKLPSSKFVSYGSVFGEAGTADIIGCINGRMILIEVKEARRQESSIQKARRREWTAAGALWLTVHSLKELKKLFNQEDIIKCQDQKRTEPEPA